jgi:hypothetical protein
MDLKNIERIGKRADLIIPVDVSIWAFIERYRKEQLEPDGPTGDAKDRPYYTGPYGKNPYIPLALRMKSLKA